MRRNKAFPGPGDRVRLAIPQLDDLAPLVRYGTVIERSCGRSDALKVRWDDTARRSGFAADGGTEGWLADAGWYWDRGHLRVVSGTEVEEVTVAAPVRAASRPSQAAEDDGWLLSGPRGAGPAAGQDGSVDATAEWEAALASELEVGPDGDWEELLARALGQAAPASPARPAAAPPRPAPAAVRPTPPPAPAPSRPAPQVEARPTPPPAAAAEPTPAPAPPKPVQPWTGDDIIPRGGGKRRGRR